MGAHRDELKEKVEGFSAAEQVISDKINEKNDEMEAVKEEIEKFNEIKETLEALCERLGIENEELMAIKTKSKKNVRRLASKMQIWPIYSKRPKEKRLSVTLSLKKKT